MGVRGKRQRPLFAIGGGESQLFRWFQSSAMALARLNSNTTGNVDHLPLEVRSSLEGTVIRLVEHVRQNARCSIKGDALGEFF